MRFVYHGIEAKTDSKHRQWTTGAVISSVGVGRWLEIFSQFAVERPAFSTCSKSTLWISKKLAESPRILHPHFRLSAIANMQETLAKWSVVRNQICNFASDASRSYLLSSFH